MNPYKTLLKVPFIGSKYLQHIFCQNIRDTFIQATAQMFISVNRKLMIFSFFQWSTTYMLQCKGALLFVCRVARCDSEHPAGPKGQPGEDEGLLGCRLLPRREHPGQRAQKSHRGLGKTVQALTSNMVRLEPETQLISDESAQSDRVLQCHVRLAPSFSCQVCGLHHGDVHPVPTVCQAARGEISQTRHCGLLDGAAAADLQAHRFHWSLPSKTTMRTSFFKWPNYKCFFF